MTTEQTSEQREAADKRARVIDKIKKCLSLAKSANEHEAAAAMRQAQKLMKAYQIDEFEVEGQIIVREYVDTREKFSNVKPHSLQALVSLIIQAFGVMGMWGRSPSGRHRITYWGNRASVIVAIHAHKMCYRAADEGWEKYKSAFYAHAGKNPPKIAKGSYLLGWCQSVESKVENLAPNKEQMERLKRAAEAKMGMAPGELGSTKARDLKLDNHAAWNGLEAGKDFNLHIPLTQGNS